MNLIETRDPDRIRDFVLKDPSIHLYELGDLDPFFWPSTTWWGLEDRGDLSVLALLYQAPGFVVLLCFGRDRDLGAELLRQVGPKLPDRLYAHICPGFIDGIEDVYVSETFGEYQKMYLPDAGKSRSELEQQWTKESPERADRVSRLQLSDLPALEVLYRESYPDNAFDPRMLETGKYFGWREGESLLGVAGIHVYSKAERVGVLGNVTTHPKVRGQGVGRSLCARLCLDLLEDCDHVGLNVARNNEAAIRLYESLGFVHAIDYEERMLHRDDMAG